jgi:DnaJ-class molecular chaperone
MKRNFYLVLGVPLGASLDEVHDAYRRLAREYHPDTSGGETARKFLEVQEAWETLKDPQRRRQYDDQLSQQPSPRQRTAASPPTSSPAGPAVARRWREVLAEAGSILHLVLRLRAGEAAHGGTYPLELPAVERCPHCQGMGRWLFQPCPACGGAGRALCPEPFLVRIPPGVDEGDVLPFSLAGYGLLHSRLLICIHIMG